MPQYTTSVGEAPSPLPAWESPSVGEFLASLWACIASWADGSDLSLGFVPALGSTTLEVDGCLAGGLAL